MIRVCRDRLPAEPHRRCIHRAAPVGVRRRERGADIVTHMDRAWMKDQLEQYLILYGRYGAAQRSAAYSSYTDSMRALDHEAETLQPTVERILRALDPKLLDGLLPLGYDMANIDSRIRQALGILRDLDEWARRLSPDAPTLSADGMHPLMWSAASPVWSTGQYRVAVQQATVALSASIKKRARSTLSDRELVQRVFAPDPPKDGQVRLHLAGDRADRSWQSRQQGLHLLAQGAFAGIRNIAAHDEAEWTEQEALEHLAVLSVIARWADEADQVEGA